MWEITCLGHMYTLNVLIKVPLSDFKCSYFEFKFWHSNFEIIRPSPSITPCIHFRNLTFSGNTVLCLFFHQIAAICVGNAIYVKKGIAFLVYYALTLKNGAVVAFSERWLC